MNSWASAPRKNKNMTNGMTEREAFDEWWKLMKPAEVDELKDQFIDCWQAACQWQRERGAQICNAFDTGEFIPTHANAGFVGGVRACAKAIQEQEK